MLWVEFKQQNTVKTFIRCPRHPQNNFIRWIIGTDLFGLRNYNKLFTIQEMVKLGLPRETRDKLREFNRYFNDKTTEKTHYIDHEGGVIVWGNNRIDLN